MAAFIITKNIGEPGKYHFFAGYEDTGDGQITRMEPQFRLEPFEAKTFPTPAQAEVIREGLAEKFKNMSFSLMEMEIKLTPISLNAVKTSYARSPKDG